MKDYKHLYEIACRVGERHANQAVNNAHMIRKLRNVIWRATIQLRAGHPDRARKTLEDQIKKDQP